MKKVKLQIPTSEWDDIRSKYAPDDNRFVGQNAFTDGTQNIDTETDGTIRKMKGGVKFATVANPPKDQHEAIFSDGTRHLLEVDSGTLRFTAGEPSFTDVTSGYSTAGNFEFATTQDRVYFGNGINANQVYDKTENYGGVAYSAPRTKDMGAQEPSTAPTLNSQDSATEDGVPVGDHTYKVTFLYYDFEESNGSPSSTVINVSGTSDNEVTLDIPTGDYGVTDRKIYRDDNDGVYVLVGTVNNNTDTTFTDTALAGTTPIPTDNGAPPSFGLIQLFLDRLWFAKISGEPFTLYFSEVGFPDIVESTNFIEADREDPITALVVYRGRLVVFNRRSMGQILGDTKDSFRYETIEGSVGCVDNRTVQEVVVNGVPTLIWLSDKGFYGFNGSSISYLSDSIEDLVNVNIQQAVVQKNQQVQTTDADFNAGTLSDGILVQGGQITTRGFQDGTSTSGTNPRRTWDDKSDWDGGSSLDNVATIDQGSDMTFAQELSEEPATEGTRDNLEPAGVGVQIPTSDDFTGETKTDAFAQIESPSGALSAVAWSFVPDRTGTLNGVSTRVNSIGHEPVGGTATYRVKVWEDSGGVPGAVLTDSGDISATIGSFGQVLVELNDFSVGNPTLTGGQRYHFGVEFTSGGGTINAANSDSFDLGARVLTTSGWISANFASSSSEGIVLAYSYTTAPSAASGTWTSSVLDTKSNSADPTTIAFTATYPSGTGSETTLIGGDSLDFAGNIIVDETQTINDIDGSATITLGARRYYRVRIKLTTNDDRTTPSVDSAVDFNTDTTAVWISEAIDTTGDSTTYDTFNTVSTTPGSSTVVTEIRTADTEGGLTSAPWVAFGSHTVRKWAQVRITMTKDGGNEPVVSSHNFTWTIVANLVSSAINTTVDPAGWDIFQSDFSVNGGTVLFEQRSASTESGLSSATFFTVTNGDFPPTGLPTDQYTQWRATITASDTNVPTVASVTIRWFETEVNAVRAASIFHDKDYYVALAEFGNDQNNIIIQLDARGKWRVKRGLDVSTLGFFFNDPYFGSSTQGVVGRFLQSFKDLGSNIVVDVRTKAFDYSNSFFDNSEFDKIPESVILEGRGTGATYTVSYSLDNGATFTDFKDAVTGTASFTTTNDNKLFQRVFRVDAETNGFEGAETIMYRVQTNDEFDVKLHRLKATAFITRKEPIITG